MKRLNPSLFLAAAIALCANSALAQGTMLFTWNNMNHPQSLFQASFQIYDWEQAPGIEFHLADPTFLFERNFTVVAPDHTWVGGGCYYSGFHPDLYLDVTLNGSWSGGDPFGYVYVTAGRITEYPASGPVLWETGYWTFEPVPEPSSAAFLALGLLAFAGKKAISRK